MLGKMQITLRDFRGFRGADSRGARQNGEKEEKKKRERKEGGNSAGRWCLPDRRDITEQRCTHIVATLARYCFMLQNIAFYLRVGASHVENSLVRGVTVSVTSSILHRTGLTIPGWLRGNWRESF